MFERAGAATSRRLIWLGLDLLRAGDRRGARRVLTEAGKTDDPLVLHALGVVCLRAEELELAEQCLLRAVVAGARGAATDLAVLIGRSGRAAGAEDILGLAGDVGDARVRESLDRLLSLLRQGADANPAAADVPPDDPLMLARVLSAAYSAQGDPALLARAVAASQAAAAAGGGPLRHAAAVAMCCTTARMAAEQDGGDPAMLEEAVRAGREAAALTPASHLSYPWALDGLAKALVLQHERQGGAGPALDEALELFREAARALPAGHPEEHAFTANVARVLINQGIEAGDPGVLDEGIGAARAALRVAPPGTLAYVMEQVNLGSALLARSSLAGGTAASVDEAQGLLREAAAALPRRHPVRQLAERSLRAAPALRRQAGRSV